MDEIARSWYDLRFEIAFLKKKGNEFQNFFATIMEKVYPGDFIPVRPWGNTGDRKNDGYLKSQRTLFQVYAPNDMDQNQAIKKINEDFLGALSHWPDHFDKWGFVHNATELPPHVLERFLELEQAHPPIQIENWGFARLHQEMRKLNHDDLILLFGHAPSSSSMREVGFQDLKIVLDFISQKQPVSDPDLRPPPVDKIERNLLSDSVDTLLKAGMRRSDHVKRFLELYHDPLYGDRIVEAFKQQYALLKEKGLLPDEIFMELMRFAGGAQRGTPKHESSVLAILAYLFEACDIFERESGER